MPFDCFLKLIAVKMSNMDGLGLLKPALQNIELFIRHNGETLTVIKE